jgi:hypothetical protein
MSGLDDGWDDDASLAVSQQEEEEEEEEGGGWGEDEDLDLDGEDEEMVQPMASVSPTPAMTTNHFQQHGIQQGDGMLQEDGEDNEMEQNANGWGDEDDDLQLDDDLNLDDDGSNQNDNSNQYPHQETQPEQHHIRHQQGFNSASMDDDPAESNGWSDEDELLVGDDEAAEIAPPKQNAPADGNPKSVRLRHELEAYIRSLSHMLSSINAILDYEYNTPGKAHELQAYYATREKLAEYTRTKELHRMDYEVILPYGHVETDKAQIAEYLSDESLVSRCSNQSLLADLLQVMTGSDLLVRPQYMAICYAHWCHFKIHLGGERGDMVHCSCKLHLSLPTAEGKRLNVAELHASVVFAPDQPMVQYHLHSINVLLLEQDFFELRGTAEFLGMMEEHMDDFPEQQGYSSNTPADNYRDNFVENSQKLLSQSTQGMKSALQQVDAVINIQRKIDIVKAGYSTFSKFLPDTDDLLAAEEEAMAYAAREQESSRFPRPPPPQGPPPAQQQQPQQHFGGGPPPPPPRGHDPLSSFPRPPLSHGPPPGPLQDGPRSQQQQQPPPGGAARPQSILGGLMRSGFTRLAKTVAIPDEQDPAIYGAVPVPVPQSAVSQVPQLYRQGPVPAVTRLGMEPKPRPPQDQLVNAQIQEPPSNVTLPQKQSHWEAAVEPSRHTNPRQGLVTESAKAKSPPTSSQNRVEKPVQIRAPESPPTKIREETTPPASSSNVRQVESPSSRPAHSKDEPPSMAIQASSSFDTAEAPVEASEIFEVAETDESIDNEIVASVDNEESISNHSEEKEAEETKGVDHQSVSPRLIVEQPETKTKGSSASPRVIKRDLIAHVEYNPEDDIIETRKRWNNPRPHRPHVLL